MPAVVVVFSCAAQVLDKFKLFEGSKQDEPTRGADEQIGVDIVKRAAEEPLRQIVASADCGIGAPRYFLRCAMTDKKSEHFE